MAIKRTKRNIKKTAKPVAPKENVVKREKTKKPKTQKPIEKKAPPKASQPKPKQPKRDYNREYSNSFEDAVVCAVKLTRAARGAQAKGN